MNNRKKICFVGFNPNFLGGSTLFLKNFIRYLKEHEYLYQITWVYSGKKDSQTKKEGIEYISIKTPKFYPLDRIIFNLRLLKFLSNKDYDLINIHCAGGMLIPQINRKKIHAKIISTFHGSEYYFYKNTLERFGFLKKILFSPTLFISYLSDLSKIKNSDKILCVSQKVKQQLMDLYHMKKEIGVIRSGVDINLFRPRDKESIMGKLKLQKDKIYGLYVGRGGYWTKGLDRAINLSKEIYKINPNYRFLVIGADKEKVEDLIKTPFVKFLPEIPREKIHYYYNISDLFFCLSRYEGGAPTLVTSEAMASGCLLVTSKDAKQEIIEDGKNGIIIGENYEKEAKRIMQIYENQNKKQKIIQNSLKTIKEFSLEKWGKKYSNALWN